MTKNFKRVILTLFLSMLVMLIACSSNLHNSSQTNGEQITFAAELISNGNAPDELEFIITRYLIKDSEIGINTRNIDFAFVFDISTEGASFFTVYSDYGNLEYFGIDILGEMGRISHSYTFTEQFIIYSVVEILYNEPFFINPMGIPIRTVYINRYVISNGAVFRFVDEGEHIVVQNEHRDSIINKLIYFLQILYP